jgi:hypothetical protein
MKGIQALAGDSGLWRPVPARNQKLKEFHHREVSLWDYGHDGHEGGKL